MTSIGKSIADLKKHGEHVRIMQGVVQSVDWTTGTARVLIDGQGISVVMLETPSNVGEAVWVLTVGEIAVTLGKPARAALGTVQSAPASNRVQVSFDDGTSGAIPYLSGATSLLTSGRRVLVDWDAGGHVVDAVSTETAGVDPGEGPGGNGGRREETFYTSDSGSFRGGWWTTKVYYAENNPIGAWFMGNAIADTIPDGAPINDVWVRLRCELSQGSSQTIIGLHSHGSKPGGAFGLIATTDIGPIPAGFDDWVRLPQSWGDLLKVGTARGVGVSGPGYRIFSGVESGMLYGALKIGWTE